MVNFELAVILIFDEAQDMLQVHFGVEPRIQLWRTSVPIQIHSYCQKFLLPGLVIV